MVATTGRRINVEDAKIRTANVEIKTLTVGGKQVTLAVFRQLIEEPLIDEETLQLRGVPWGHVNYHSGVGCDDFKDADHLHVVWQKGNELRRACTRKRAGKYTPRKLVVLDCDAWDDARAWNCAAIAEGWRPKNYETLREYRGNSDNIPWSGKFVVTVHGLLHEMWVNEAMDSLFHPLTRVDGSVVQARMDKAIEELRQDARIDGVYQGPDVWLAECEKSAARFKEYRDRYDAAYAALEQLDQLFIAV